MMKKIFICIFSIFFPILAQSKREEKRQLEMNIQNLLNQKKYSEATSILKSFTEKFPYELKYRLLYGKSILVSESLETPETTDEIFIRNQKIEKAHENYKKAVQILEPAILEFESKTPGDKSLGRWYFYLGTAETYTGNKNKAIKYFKKSYQLDSSLTEAIYNTASLQENLGLIEESKSSFQKYMNIKFPKKQE